jgi:hypothetical protein
MRKSVALRMQDSVTLHHRDGSAGDAFFLDELVDQLVNAAWWRRNRRYLTIGMAICRFSLKSACASCQCVFGHEYETCE